MEKVSLCPFTVGDLVWQAQGGVWTASVCVKGTFSLLHQRDAALVEAQEPPDERDLVPFKPKTDVLVLGSAHAPGGVPVETLVVRFSVGDLAKSIGVIGDRVWREGPDGLEPSAPTAFTSMPLAYHRAPRGPENPAGLDLGSPPVVNEALPNFEAVDDGYVEGRVLGLGPVDAAAPARRGLLDPVSLAWLERREGAVPDGFEFRYFNNAPGDQQLSLLRHGATIVLENLNRELPRIESRLPLLRPKAFLVHEETQRASEIALRCDTVTLDGDAATATLIWRGLVGIDAPDMRATIVVAAESPRKRLHYKHIEKMLKDGNSWSLNETMNEQSELGRRHDTVKARASSPAIEPSEATPVPPSWNLMTPVMKPAPSAEALPDAQPADAPQPGDRWYDVTTARIHTEGIEVRASMPSITLAEDGWGPGIEDFTTEERPRPPRPEVNIELKVADYARISLSIERGEIGSVLNELGIGLAELAALRAAWSERLAGDPALSSEFERELAQAKTPD